MEDLNGDKIELIDEKQFEAFVEDPKLSQSSHICTSIIKNMAI